MGLLDRLQHGFNAFMNKDPTRDYRDYGMSHAYRPDRPRLTRGNERSIVTAIYNRIALDVAAITIKHCKLDDNDRYLEDVDSSLNNCLNLEANIDQTGRAFMQDAVMSMLDEGVVALVPIDTSDDPMDTSSYDILSMRTGKIIQWYPAHVKVRVYNDRTGEKEEIILRKDKVAIVENPLYAVINEPNSTMQRLIRKLSLLDIVDEQSSAGKLDLIIQLPYVIKSEARRTQAESRRKDIEMQLSGSKYGIAYTDGTERITQLNRPLENNLLKQIEYLTNMLYSQLSFHQTILDGTADEKTMLNYNNRIIEPIVSAFVDEMKRTFLTKTARTQKQTILFFRDPFKLVPVADIAEIADKFTRNEIMTSNEIRQIVGMKPSTDPNADRLLNSNLNHPGGPMGAGGEQTTEEGDAGADPNQMTPEQYKQSVADLDDLDAQLDELEKLASGGGDLKHYASPYYDPVKAHEYYMKNRELKNRKSTSMLNEEGRSAAKYIREQLDAEKKSKIDQSNASTNASIAAERESVQSKIKAEKESIAGKVEQHKQQVQSKIDALWAKYENMSGEEQEKYLDQLANEIEELRASNETIRKELDAQYKQTSENLRSGLSSMSSSLRGAHKETKSKLKAEYDEKYLAELDKLKADPKFKKKRKSSRTSTKS